MIALKSNAFVAPDLTIFGIWVPSGLVGLEVWLIVVSLGLLVLVAEIIRLVIRAGRPANEVVGNSPELSVRNTPTGVVPLSISPKELNLRDQRYRRCLGPFESVGSPGARPPMPWTRVPSPPLRGQVVLVSMFVGADGRWWSDTEIARQLGALERAARWMEKEASRYGVPVGVGLADTYFSVEGEPTPEVAIGFESEGMDVGPYEHGIATRALTLMSRTAATLGLQDAVDFVQEIRVLLPGTTPVWLLHVRQAGRSLAVPLDLTELEGVSLASVSPAKQVSPNRSSGPPFLMLPPWLMRSCTSSAHRTSMGFRSTRFLPPWSLITISCDWTTTGLSSFASIH